VAQKRRMTHDSLLEDLKKTRNKIIKKYQKILTVPLWIQEALREFPIERIKDTYRNHSKK
jgi:hypothetical protein